MRTAYIPAGPGTFIPLCATRYTRTLTLILPAGRQAVVVVIIGCYRLCATAQLVTTRPQILKYDEVEHTNTRHVVLNAVKCSCSRHRAKTKNVWLWKRKLCSLKHTHYMVRAVSLNTNMHRFVLYKIPKRNLPIP